MNSYEAAESRFRDLIGAGREQRNAWMKVAAVVLASNVALVGTVVVLVRARPVQMTETRTIVLDSEGHRIEGARANAAQWRPSEPMRRSHMIDLVQHSFELSVDRLPHGPNEVASDYVRKHVLPNSQAATKLLGYREALLAEELKRVVVTVTEMVPSGENEWHARWTCEREPIKGPLQIVHMAGVFFTQTVSLNRLGDEWLDTNPIGLLTERASWAEDLKK